MYAASRHPVPAIALGPEQFRHTRPAQADHGRSLRLESLLEMAKRRFCVNPDPALTTRAERNAWPIYQWNLTKDAV